MTEEIGSMEQVSQRGVTRRANVLILETYCDSYARALRQAFPSISVIPVQTIDAVEVSLSEIDVLITFGISINDEIMKNLARLQWIQSLATGVDHFLRSPYLRPETLLTSARGIHGPAMRESTLFLMQSVSREAGRLIKRQAAHEWDRSQPWPLLSGKTAMLVGVGISSTAIAHALRALGMTIIGVSRTPREVDGFDRVVSRAALVETAPKADYIINVLPGDADNTDLIGRDVFAAMKPTAFFINVGRGETVDEEAMILALREQRLAGAGLDVFATEPLPPESPLWDMPNVIVSPHISGFFREYEEFVMSIVIENMGLFLEGRHEAMANLVAH